MSRVGEAQLAGSHTRSVKHMGYGDGGEGMPNFTLNGTSRAQFTGLEETPVQARGLMIPQIAVSVI